MLIEFSLIYALHLLQNISDIYYQNELTIGFPMMPGDHMK